MERDARLIKQQYLLILATAIVGLVTACGGGGGGSSSVAPGASGNTPANSATPASGSTAGPMVSMSLSILIPAKKTTSALRPQYISPNSESISFTLASVNGVVVSNPTTQGPYNLVAGPTNPNCTTGQNGTTCTFSINAPIGTDIFTATTFSNTNGTGALGSGAVLLSVQQNRANTASLTLTGPVATVQLFASTQTLYNGNPVPITECSDCSIHRGAGQTLAQARAPAAAAAQRSSAGAVRKPLVVSATPAPYAPVATTGRVFVIATDVNGNQIINPTTFDINITLTLALNGTTPGQVTLTDTYAGLPGEPGSPASTTADGGTVTVMAPSDNVTVTISGTNASSFTPTVTASYTPQGGSAQTGTPLAFTVENPPPAAELGDSATHVDPLTVGIAANLTNAIINIGTAPTSAQIEADAYTYDLTYNGLGPGSDPSWNGNCTFYNYGDGYGDIQCFSNAVVAPNASLPLVLNVTPSSSGSAYDDFWAYNGGAVNGSNGVEAYDPINVSNNTSQLLAISTTSSTNPFYSTVPATLTFDMWNPGPVATSGGLAFSATLPQNSSAYTYTGYSSSDGLWTCSGSSPNISCTYSGVLAANGNSGSNNTTLTLDVTPPTSDTDDSQTWSGTVNGGGALSPATANGSAYEQSAIYFDSAPGFASMISTANGNAFVSGDQATLEWGSPPSSSVDGSVSITTQSPSSSSYSIQSDSCTGSLIDGTFSGSFPVMAGTVNVGVPVNLNLLSQSGAAGPCQIVIQDVHNNTATLNIGVDQNIINVEGYRRKAGSKH